MNKESRYKIQGTSLTTGKVSIFYFSDDEWVVFQKHYLDHYMDWRFDWSSVEKITEDE